MQPTLTQSLIAYIRGKPVSQQNLHTAALFTLDAIANCVAGRNSAPGEILRHWHGSEIRDTARRAFLMGGLTHIQETDDLHRSSVTHPGCVVVPAVLAVGARKQASGKDLLAAVLQGFEAMCRIGNAVGPTHYKVWHNTATCGPFGAAMAVAALMDLDDDQCMHALGNAGTQSAGLWEFLETGAMSKHLHAGRAAEAGVVAAELAMKGFTGPPAILEGNKGFFAGACPDADPAKVLVCPDEGWQLSQTSIKPWPCCRHTHPCIDAALALHDNLKNESISVIEARVYQATLDVCNRPEPGSEYEGKFSIQHCIAAAIEDGAVTFESFSAESSQRLADTRRKVQAAIAEPYKSAYPDQYWGGSVSVTTGSGRTTIESRQACKGDPEAALTTEEMVNKARQLMMYGGMDNAAADALIEAALNLAKGCADWQVLRSAFPEIRGQG